MGELATYSAILSKTGLGKAGNECPPKSVILALGSGLEISNADTYGDNEGVKLEDIHRSEWNYYFTIDKTSFNLPALGGNAEYKILSYKKHVVDGVEDPDAPLVPVGLTATSSGDMVWSNESDWDYNTDFTTWANREHTNYSKSRFEIIDTIKNRYLMFKSNWSDPSVIVQAIPAFDVKLTGVKEGLTVGYRYITGNWNEGVGANIGINEIPLKNNEVNHLPAGVDSDGVHITEVGFTLLTNPPDFSDAIGITVEQVVEKFNGRLVISENQGLTAKVSTIVYTQKESGKTLTINLTQAAATSTWEYTFTKSNGWVETTPAVGALGGDLNSGGIKGVSTKQEYRNGKLYGSPVVIPSDVSVDVDWITLPVTVIDDISVEERFIQVVTENKSESQRVGNLTFTQMESGKTFIVKRIQDAGVKTYGTPTVYLGTATDIPASGGTSTNPTYTYAQLWGWNGKTSDGGTISTGATVSWSASVSGSNLGSVQKARTKLGTRTLTVTLNGKSNTASYDVYQSENKIVSSTPYVYTVNISANPETISNLGGTSIITTSAVGNRTNTWSSGSNSGQQISGTPTLSIPTPVAGFSLSGNTLTVAENTTPNNRSVVIRATYEGVTKDVTVNQTAYVVTYEYTFTTSTPTLNFDAFGTTKMPNLNSYREKYINGQLVEGSVEGVAAVTHSIAGPVKDVSPNGITLEENTTTSTKTGTVIYQQVGSGKLVTITCNQAAGTVTNEYIIELVADFPSIANTGGILKGYIRSGYYKVVNGVRDTFYMAPPVLDGDLPSWLSNLKFVQSSGIVGNKEFNYEVQISASENTGENIRRASIKLIFGGVSATMNIAQGGASITWNYELEVKHIFDSGGVTISNVPGPGEEITAVILSRRIKVINGTVTNTIENVVPTLNHKQSWTSSIRIDGSRWDSDCYDADIRVDANSSPNSRTGTIEVTQSGSSNKKTIFINQSKAEVTTVYTMKYIDGETTTWNPTAKAQSISINVISYKEEFINGVLNRTTQVLPTPSFVPMNINWASIEVISLGSDSNGYEYMFELTIQKNNLESERSFEVTWGPDMTGPAYKVTQQAAVVEWKGTMYFGEYGSGSNSTTQIVQKDDTSARTIKLQSYKSKYINGIEDESTRVAMKSKREYPIPGTWVFVTYANIPGEIETRITINAATVNQLEERSFYINFIPDDSEITNASAIGTRTLTFTQRGITVGKRYEFSWKTGSSSSGSSSIYNVTLAQDGMEGVSFDIDCYSYLVNEDNGLELANTRDYFQPTVSQMGASWATLHPNAQNADKSWNYSILVTANESSDNRTTSFSFTNDFNNGNPQTLNLYILQIGLPTADEVEFSMYNNSPGNSANINTAIRLGIRNMDTGGTIQDKGIIARGEMKNISEINFNFDLVIKCRPGQSSDYIAVSLTNIISILTGSPRTMFVAENPPSGAQYYDYEVGIITVDGSTIGSNNWFISREVVAPYQSCAIKLYKKKLVELLENTLIASFEIIPNRITTPSLPTISVQIVYGNPGNGF